MSAAAYVPVTETTAPGEIGAVLAREAAEGRKPLMIVTGTADGVGTLAVLADVAAERRKQDVRWGHAHDDDHVDAEWRGFRDYYEDAASDAADRRDAPALRRDLVRIAALAVAQVEALDRAAARKAGVRG